VAIAPVRKSISSAESLPGRYASGEPVEWSLVPAL